MCVSKHTRLKNIVVVADECCRLCRRLHSLTVARTHGERTILPFSMHAQYVLCLYVLCAPKRFDDYENKLFERAVTIDAIAVRLDGACSVQLLFNGPVRAAFIQNSRAARSERVLVQSAQNACKKAVANATYAHKYTSACVISV